jgi:hemoglobin/transferrin/lactoferrin receptor protein
LLAGCLASARAFAQSQPQTFEHEVVVTGKSEAERDKSLAFAASLGATSVSGAEMRDEAPQSLADAMRGQAPGVSIQQTTPGQGTVSVRGLSGRALVYAVDGVRLNMAFFRAGNNDYLGLVDPYALRSVIVAPGAASVEYGSDALGGAVLMNTETPAFRLHSPLTSAAFFQSVGSNPVGTSTRVVVRHERDHTSALLGFTYFQSGAVRPGEGELSPEPESYRYLERDAGEAYQPRLNSAQVGTEFEAYAANAAVRQRLGPGTQLIVRGQYSVRPELVRYDQVTPRFGGDVPARAERSLEPMSRAMVSVGLVQRATESFYDSAEVQLAWQRIDERRTDRRLDELCIDPAADPPLEPEDCTGRLRLEPRGERVFEENASNSLGLRAELRKANPSKSLSLIVGADSHHDIVSSEASSLNLADGVETPEESRYPDGATLSDAALFVHVRVRPLPKLHLFAGLRGGAFHIAMDPRASDEAESTVRQTYWEGAGTIGAHWEFADGVAWVSNGGRAVRAPNIEDIAAVGTRAQGRYQIPNPDLQPEHSYTVDTGLKLLRGANSAHVMAFFTRYDDAIVLAPTTSNGSSTTPDGDEYYHSTNATFVDLYGVEAAFDVALLRRFSTYLRALVMQGTQHSEAGTGLPSVTPADRVPPAQAELGVRYRPLQPLELEAFSLLRAAQRRLNDPVNLEDNRIPEGGTPGYVTYHARLKYSMTPSLLARLSFDNITNELVLEHGSGFYRSGFSVTGSVELGFGER